MQYGYGCGFKGPFIYIAVIILIVHVVVASIHIGVVLREGTRSSVWSSPGELLALAINSEREPKLGNTGAGVRSKQTWALMAKVRECDVQWWRFCLMMMMMVVERMGAVRGCVIESFRGANVSDFQARFVLLVLVASWMKLLGLCCFKLFLNVDC